MSNLVIVESPAKIKKLQSFLGSDYTVLASYGHFRDLDPKKLSVDLTNDFKPDYSISSGKQNVVRELKAQMKKCSMVYLASDFDREGEAIAWHIKEILKLNATNAKRIVFTEITKNAILNAVDNPTTININMFYAQQARRILDRIIGYLISPILWKQIQSSYTQKKSLSAGRVQSVVVKLVMEREEEIKKFESSPYFKISGTFDYEKSNLPADLNKEKEITSIEDAKTILEFSQEADFFIDDVKTRKTKRQPPLPFITSSLQQEASQKLGMSPKETMSIAQKLYEKGKITYMRTDSLVLSAEAHQAIKEKVEKEFGKKFYLLNKKTVGKGTPDTKETKSKKGGKGDKEKPKGKKKEDNNNSQEAHEACRPTNFQVPSLSDASISYRENRLYKLIWGRTVASQMKPAEADITSIKIKMKQGNTTHKYHFVSKKEVITFLGYLKVTEYLKNLASVNQEAEVADEDEGEGKPVDEDDDILTVEIKKGKKVTYKKITADEKLTKPPQPHYQEASLIKKLDELGIGRPSTYATMISNVQDRNYVEKKTIKAKEKEMQKLVLQKNKIKEKTETVKVGGEKDKLFPTNLGEIVNRFLVEHFPEILDYKFTAHVENQLDEVAQGNIEWVEVVREIYQKIRPKLEEMKVSLTQEKDKYKRELGIDPQSGATLTTYIGKFGPLVQFQNEMTETTRFAPLGDLKMEEVTLEQALKLFAYPKSLGEYKKKEVLLCKGKYGFYLKYGDKNISIPKLDNTIENDGANRSDEVKKQEPINPETMTLKEAKKIIADSFKAYKEHELDYVNDKGTTITITVRKGQYGPYFNYQGKNYSIYKTYDANNLSGEDVKKILSYKKKGTSTKSVISAKKNEGKTRDRAKESKSSKIKENTPAEKKKVKPKKKKVIKKTE